jgi:TIGR03009 family protein
MRRTALAFVTSLVTAISLSMSSLRADDPLPPLPDEVMPTEKAGPKIDEILSTWEAQSKGLTSIELDLTREDTSPTWSIKDEFTGRLLMEKPNRTCLHLREKNPLVDEPNVVDSQRIIDTGKEVRQYDYKTKQILVFALTDDARRAMTKSSPPPAPKNVFDLKQAFLRMFMGPVHLPIQLERFIFGFQADEMKARYEWTLLKETPELALISVTPRLEADKLAFSFVYIGLDKKTHVPSRILIIDPNGKDKQEYRFQVVAMNTKIDPKYFEPLTIKGWKTVINPTTKPESGR